MPTRMSSASVRSALATALVRARAARWEPYSRLFLLEHSPGWSLSEDARALRRIADQLRIHVAPPRSAGRVERQAVFYLSHFAGLKATLPRETRLAVSYFHGRPGTPGYPEFDEAYDALRRRHAEVARVQVSHSEIEQRVLRTGIPPEKVRRIPIGIDVDAFSAQTPVSRRNVRERLGLPQDAFVLGSFQKDGNGWGEGLEPKLIKGPDVLVEVARRVHGRVPELHVLLTGPARGYVKRALAAQGVPYVHVHPKAYADIPPLYHALDAYAITSRQEGGPKALLEAMASGVPLVTTPVGQAMDIAIDGVNALVAPIDDAGALADRLVELAQRDSAPLVAAGRETAHQHAYAAQQPLWEAFFRGFVSSYRRGDEA